MSERVRITELGGRGDGVAEGKSGQIFVPFSLPGETVLIENGRVSQVEAASPNRIEPACRHFGHCGGCQLQHMHEDAYVRWKEQRVIQALRQHGMENPPMKPMVRGRRGDRRRATLTARRIGTLIAIGFSEAASHRLVPLAECPVLLPEIVAQLPKLKRLAVTAGANERTIRLAVTATETGLDIDLSGLSRLTEARRQALLRLGLEEGFARVTADREIIVEARKPVIMAGTAALTPPPGSFLQASAQAEAAMAERVVEHLRKSRRVADLFCGSGTFALRLASNSTVHAIDSEQAALDALDRAFRATPGLRTITHARRDLFRHPLQAKELDAFDGLVFDPPRAGAVEQAAAIARSRVRKVAAVSCNPATLARDLGLLIAGGYHLRAVTPIDQFLWSAHVEVVAELEREK